MSDEIKFKRKYQDTFNEVHAPAELSGKVMNMQKKENIRTAAFYMRKLAAVAAVALIILVGGNGIVYAATGNSLFTTVKVYFNGTDYETQLEEKVDENGNTYYEIGPFDDVEGTIGMVITDADDFEEGPYKVTVSTQSVTEEDGKIYLVDGELKLNITEDAKDGTASGSYDKDGHTFEYEATKKDETWDLSILGEDETTK